MSPSAGVGISSMALMPPRVAGGRSRGVPRCLLGRHPGNGRTRVGERSARARREGQALHRRERFRRLSLPGSGGAGRGACALEGRLDKLVFVASREAGDVAVEPIDAREVAEVALEALAAGRFLALPHPEVDRMQQQKAADRDRWISGMQRFRASLEA